ncbi:MAG: hypothetical protein M1343_08125 [Chloroflexi bacterium]|nr:hypothetical protein [Chloroflexota bacterium]
MLTDKLKIKQQELGLNDTDFARKLSVPRSTWRNAKVGIRKPSRRLALKAMGMFPDLTADCVSFLLSDDTTITNDKTHVA